MLAKNDTLDSVASTVINIITEVLSEQGLLNGTVEESAKLVDTLGLKSMDIAQIVLNLEDELDTDPFQELPITSIRTVGDLINAYRQSLDPTQSADTETVVSQDAAPAGVSRRANRRR